MNQQASNPPLEISVVVPVHNEEENIEPLIDEIRTALAGRRYEIVYVDDGSTDRSLEILLGLARKYPELQVRAHEKSCGQSTAIRTGVKTGAGALGGHPGR